MTLPSLGKKQLLTLFLHHKVSFSGRAAAKRKKGPKKRFLETINPGSGNPAVKEQGDVPAEASQQHQCWAWLGPCAGTGSTLVCNNWTGSLIKKQSSHFTACKIQIGVCQQVSAVNRTPQHLLEAGRKTWRTTHRWNRLLVENDCTAYRKSQYPNNLNKPSDFHRYWQIGAFFKLDMS